MDYNVLIALVLRHALSGVGVYLVSKGYADQDMVNEGIGAVATLSGIVWSVFQKHSTGVLKKDDQNGR